jgi:hypothetical protein
VGTFESASQANGHVDELKALGYPSFMYTQENSLGDTVYIVVAGKYQSYDLARNASNSLKSDGYINFIAQTKDSLAANLTGDDKQNLLNYLQGIKSRVSRNNAMVQILELWFPEEKISLKQSGIDTAGIFFREAANQYNLHMHPVATESDLSLIQNLNLPVIFTFHLIGHTWPKYLTAAAIDENTIYFIDGELNKTVAADRDEFLKHWSGEAYILWKNFNNLKGVISGRSLGEDVITLKQFLQELGYNDIPMTEQYDQETQQVIKDIQIKYGLNVDGLVGTLTKIALYNEGNNFIMPSLNKFITAKTENSR